MRRLIDFTAINTCDESIIALKVSREIYDIFKFENLYQICQSPPNNTICVAGRIEKVKELNLSSNEINMSECRNISNSN